MCSQIVHQMAILINSSLEMRIVTCSVLLLMVVHADFTVSDMNFAVMFVVTLNLRATNGAVRTSCRQLSAGGTTYDLIILLQFS